jgi:hypothetical protein
MIHFFDVLKKDLAKKFKNDDSSLFQIVEGDEYKPFGFYSRSVLRINVTETVSYTCYAINQMMGGRQSSDEKSFMVYVETTEGNRARIFSQAGNELRASSFPARNELSMLFPYTLFPAGNELVLKLAKNTASGVNLAKEILS